MAGRATTVRAAARADRAGVARLVVARVPSDREDGQRRDEASRAEDDICNSEDASGLPRTAEGERNVYAGAIVHAFKCAGWMPPLVAPTAKGGAE